VKKTILLIIILLALSACATQKVQNIIEEPVTEGLETAYFAGGCFWCMESDFEKLEGVQEVISGYAGGDVENPTYEQVSSGTTGHRESVKILYDPNIITYEKLIEHFWLNVDPLDGEGQFCDKGFQYTSAIFYQNDNEMMIADETKMKVMKIMGGPIYTEVLELDVFYPAEEYHQDYHNKKPVKYKTYRTLCRRDNRLEEVWKDKSVKELIIWLDNIFYNPRNQRGAELIRTVRWSDYL